MYMCVYKQMKWNNFLIQDIPGKKILSVLQKKKSCWCRSPSVTNCVCVCVCVCSKSAGEGKSFSS